MWLEPSEVERESVRHVHSRDQVQGLRAPGSVIFTLLACHRKPLEGLNMSRFVLKSNLWLLGKMD